MLNPACEENRLELPMYARSVLEPARNAAIENHLADCDACRAELLELQRLETVLEAHLPVMTPSPAFASTFANRLAAEVLAEEGVTGMGGGFLGWFRPWLVPLAVGAALAGVIVQQSMVAGPGGERVATLPEESGSQVAVQSKPAVAEPPREVASADPVPGVRNREAKPPEEVLDRLELFVDYAVIENLDVLDGPEHAG